MTHNEDAFILDRIVNLPGLQIFKPVYQKYRALIRYAFFGALTTLISVGTFILFDGGLHWNVLFANVLSWICAVLFAYVTNKTWVFDSHEKGLQAWKQMAAFFSGRLTTLLLEEAILLVFVTWLQWNSTFVKIAAQFVVLVLNYFISKLFVFKK